MLTKDTDYDKLADFFSVLTNPVRLKILDYLISECCKRKESCCSVSDIYLELGLPQPLISKHLKILKDKGLLDFTRQGNRILYHFIEKDTFKTVSDCIYKINTLNCNCHKAE